jgi:hypothetical protein
MIAVLPDISIVITARESQSWLGSTSNFKPVARVGGDRMSPCEEHAWASVGVTVFEGTVTRVWVCERCLAWTREALDADAEVPWAETILADR